MGALWPIIGQDGWQRSKLSRRRRANGRYLAAKGLRLTAEILEPRCLLTESAVLDDAQADATVDDIAVTTDTEVANTAGVTTIVVDASLWDDRGLTVLQVDDWVHIVRTGTDLDVIPPLPASESARLIFQGRDNASDVLTLHSIWAKITIEFDGGIGPETDELHFGSVINDWRSFAPFEIAPLAEFSWTQWDQWKRGSPGNTISVQFRNTELVSKNHPVDVSNVRFNEAANDVSLRWQAETSALWISDATSGVTIRLLPSPVCKVWVFGGDSDDRITVDSTDASRIPIELSLCGDDGNDTLIGGENDEWIEGGQGDDSLLGQGGDDELMGGGGDNRIDGGEGTNQIFESWTWGLVSLSSSSIAFAPLNSDYSSYDYEHTATDTFERIQNARISIGWAGRWIDDPNCSALVTLLGTFEPEYYRGDDGYYTSYEYGGAFHSLSPDEQNQLLAIAKAETTSPNYDDDQHDCPSCFHNRVWNSDTMSEGDGSAFPDETISTDELASDNDETIADLLGQGIAEPTELELTEAPQFTDGDETTLVDVDSTDDSEADATPDTDPNELSLDQLLANSDFVSELVNNDALGGLSE